MELRDALDLNGINQETGESTLKGDYSNPVEGDQKTIARGIRNVVQRFDGTDWYDLVASGGSLNVPDAVIIEKGTKADVLVNDGGEVRNLVRSATFSDGTVVADKSGTTFIVCDGNLQKAFPDGPEAWRVIQSVATTESTGEDFSVAYTTPITSPGSTGNMFKVQGVALPSGVTVQAKVYRQSDLVNSVWQNVSDAEFEDGEGAPLDESTGVIASNANLFAPGGEALQYDLRFSVPVTLKGGNALGTDIYAEVFATPIEFGSIISDTDTSTADMQFVLDEDDLGSNSNTKVPTQQSVRKYVDDMVGANVILKNGYDADTNTPNLEIAPTGILLGWMYIVTVAGTFFTKPLSIGDALISNKDDPQVEADWIILQRNLDAATIKVLYESNGNTEAFETLEKSNLSILIGAGNTTLHYHDSDRDRANHTGIQTASTISDFDTEVGNNTAVAANTTKISADGSVTTHNDVTSSGSGSIITTVERNNLGNQSGTNTGDQDLSGFVTATQVNNTTGYANYLDSSTAGSPRTYAIDTEQLLINDKTFPDGARYPDGVTSYWDSTANKFTPDQADGNYSFTIDFTADPVSRDKRMIINFVSYDAGGPGIDTVLHSRLVRLQKDDNELTHVSLSFTIGITSAIITNGVSVTLQFEETAADIYGITCGLAKVGASII